MYIPAEIKIDPLWEKLSPKVRTNVGKVVQPFRIGQLLEWGGNWQNKNRCRGLLQEIGFKLFNPKDFGPRRPNGTSPLEAPQIVMVFKVLCVWNGTGPWLAMEEFMVNGTQDAKLVVNTASTSGRAQFYIICEPD